MSVCSTLYKRNQNRELVRKIVLLPVEGLVRKSIGQHQWVGFLQKGAGPQSTEVDNKQKEDHQPWEMKIQIGRPIDGFQRNSLAGVILVLKRTVVCKQPQPCIWRVSERTVLSGCLKSKTSQKDKRWLYFQSEKATIRKYGHIVRSCLTVTWTIKRSKTKADSSIDFYCPMQFSPGRPFKQK